LIITQGKGSINPTFEARGVKENEVAMAKANIDELE
jgi:hypothetical protein